MRERLFWEMKLEMIHDLGDRLTLTSACGVAKLCPQPSILNPEP